MLACNRAARAASADFVNMVAGVFDLAAEGFDRVAALYESTPKPTSLLQRLQPENCVVWAWSLWFLGYPDRALAGMNTAAAIARESGSKSTLEGVHTYAMQICHLFRQVDLTKQHAEATVALANELGNPFRRALAEIFLGCVDATSGDLGLGLARMQHGLWELKATGSETLTECHLALIATALGQMKHFDEGLRTIEQAFLFIEKSDERFYEAEVHRLKGELLLAKDTSNAAQAQQCFRTIEISHRQRAKSWELRAAVSLARLLNRTGRRDEARAMLAEIYNWFTEGFDTADLKDAKALLELLSG